MISFTCPCLWSSPSLLQPTSRDLLNHDPPFNLPRLHPGTMFVLDQWNTWTGESTRGGVKCMFAVMRFTPERAQQQPNLVILL